MTNQTTKDNQAGERNVMSVQQYMAVQPADDHFVVVDSNGNFFAKTYSSVDANRIAKLQACEASRAELLAVVQEVAQRMARNGSGDVLFHSRIKAAIANAQNL